MTVDVEFSWATAALIFAAYFTVDLLYAWYVISVTRRDALTAATLTAIIYSLLAFGVVTYSKNVLYLIPLGSGAFCGTYLMVWWRKES